MTDIDIEKLAEAIARKLQPLLTEGLHDEVIDTFNEAVNRAMRLGIAKFENALSNLADDI